MSVLFFHSLLPSAMTVLSLLHTYIQLEILNENLFDNIPRGISYTACFYTQMYNNASQKQLVLESTLVFASIILNYFHFD